MARPWWLRLDGVPPKDLEAQRVYRNTDLPLLPPTVRAWRFNTVAGTLLVVTALLLCSLFGWFWMVLIGPGLGSLLGAALTFRRLTPARRGQVLGRPDRGRIGP